MKVTEPFKINKDITIFTKPLDHFQNIQRNIYIHETSQRKKEEIGLHEKTMMHGNKSQ
jgi:hypothetical protein